MLQFKSTTLFLTIIIICSAFSIPTNFDNDTEVKFSWTAASGDVDHYNVYVSTNGNEYVLEAITAETFYIVNGEDGYTYKIKVQAVDAAGNVGPVSEESDPVMVSLTASYASITVLLEGPYESSKIMRSELTIPTISPYADARRVETVPTNAVDWVYVEIRSNETTKVRGESMFLLNDGSVIGRNGEAKANFYGLLPGDYYLVIRHRNHLAIMSRFPVSLVQSGDSSVVDLTIKDNVYTVGEANAVKELAPGISGMYAGDANCSNGVNSADYLIVKAESGSTGYHAGDCNMSGLVSSADFLVIKLNNGKDSQVP